MKVTITKYQAVAEWKWDLPANSDVDCGICRVQFESTCSKCKYPGDDCPVITGQCTHTFHMHCISDWLQADASRGRCPMCRQTFRQRVAAGNANANANAAATAAANPATPASGSGSRPQSSRSGRNGTNAGTRST